MPPNKQLTLNDTGAQIAPSPAVILFHNSKKGKLCTLNFSDFYLAIPNSVLVVQFCNFSCAKKYHIVMDNCVITGLQTFVHFFKASQANTL